MKLKHFDDESLDDLYRSNNGYFLFDPISNEAEDEESNESKDPNYDFLFKAIEPDFESQSPYPDDIINNDETEAEEEEKD